MTDKQTSPNSGASSSLAIYSIGKVSEMTGINAITLRAWERRYNIVAPQRTEKGHRLYTEKDIDTLNTVTRLVSQGIQISRVKSLIDSSKDPALDIIPENSRHDQSQWLKHKADIFEHINKLNMIGLEKIHQQLFANYTALELGNMLCRTILEDLHQEAETNSDAAGHYHIYHGFLRLFLARHIIDFDPSQDGIKLLVIDQTDETSRLLMRWYEVLLRAEGYNPLLIDRNPPLDAIPSIVSKFKPEAIIIYDCEHIPFELTEAIVDTPIFITNKNQTDIQLASDKIKSLPYDLLDNIAAVKELLPLVK